MNTAMIFSYLICFNDISLLAIEITGLRKRYLRMRLFIYFLSVCGCLVGLMTSVAETAWRRMVSIKGTENCVEGSGPDIVGGIMGLAEIY
jgi:hypothetical protein